MWQDYPTLPWDKYFNFLTGDGMNAYMAYRVTTKVGSTAKICEYFLL